MASQELREKIRDELQCSLCFNTITEPKVLQCPHTFCRQCLEKHNTFLRTHRSSTDCENPLREDEFECPTCRQITHLPRGRVDSLSTNLQLAKVVRILGAEGEKETDRAPQMVCEVHSTRRRVWYLDNFCEECRELVCNKCMHSPQHRNHKQSVQLAIDLLPKRVEALQALAKGISAEVASIEQLRETMQERHIKNRDEITRAIKASHEKMLEHLQKRVNGLLAAIHESTEGKLTALKQSLQTLSKANIFTCQTSKDVEQMLMDENLNILVQEQNLTEELKAHQQAVQNVAKQLSGSEARLDLILRFEEASSYIYHSLSTFGHLTECQFDPSTMHNHPRLKVRNELQVGDDGETYVQYTETKPTNLPPTQLEYGHSMMPPVGAPYPTPAPGYMIVIHPATMLPMYIPIPGSVEGSSPVVGGTKVDAKPTQGADVRKPPLKPTPEEDTYSYTDRELLSLESTQNVAMSPEIRTPSPGGEDSYYYEPEEVSLATGQSCSSTPPPPPSLSSSGTPSQGLTPNSSPEFRRKPNTNTTLPPCLHHSEPKSPSESDPEELYEECDIYLPPTPHLPAEESDAESEQIREPVQELYEELSVATGDSVLQPRRSNSFSGTSSSPSFTPQPPKSKANSQSSTPQYRGKISSACLLPLSPPPPSPPHHSAVSPELYDTAVSPEGRQGSPGFGQESIYEDVDDLPMPPPAINQVRRPKYDRLPPIPPNIGLIQRGASIIRPVQMIENHQFRPESSINVRPSDVCCTGVYNNIIITDQSNHCLRVIERNVTFATRIGDASFNVPVAIAVTPDNYFFYVVDQQNARILKFAADGTLQFKFGKKKGQQILKKPQGIAIRPATGDVYVADSEKQRVYVYQSDGTYICPIGKNEKTIAFTCPVSVAITKSDHLLVTDRSTQGSGRNCVWCIRQPEEELIRRFGEGILQNPSGISVTDDGTILVSEADNGTVCVFSWAGELIRRFGQMGVEPGMFNQPSGICIKKGQVIIADKGNNRVQIFRLRDILREQ